MVAERVARREQVPVNFLERLYSDVDPGRDYPHDIRYSPEQQVRQQFILRNSRSATTRHFVFRDRRCAVGMFSLVHHGATGTMVENVAVAPEFRGRGLGTQVFRAAVVEAGKAGASTVFASVVNRRDISFHILERLGFRDSHRKVRMLRAEAPAGRLGRLGPALVYRCIHYLCIRGLLFDSPGPSQTAYLLQTPATLIDAVLPVGAAPPAGDWQEEKRHVLTLSIGRRRSGLRG